MGYKTFRNSSTNIDNARKVLRALQSAFTLSEQSFICIETSDWPTPLARLKDGINRCMDIIIREANNGVYISVNTSKELYEFLEANYPDLKGTGCYVLFRLDKLTDEKTARILEAFS